MIFMYSFNKPLYDRNKNVRCICFWCWCSLCVGLHALLYLVECDESLKWKSCASVARRTAVVFPGHSDFPRPLYTGRHEWNILVHGVKYQSNQIKSNTVWRWVGLFSKLTNWNRFHRPYPATPAKPELKSVTSRLKNIFVNYFFSSVIRLCSNGIFLLKVYRPYSQHRPG